MFINYNKNVFSKCGELTGQEFIKCRITSVFGLAPNTEIEPFDEVSQLN